MVLSRAKHSPVSTEEAVCYRKRLANSVSNSHTGNPLSTLLVSSKVRSQFPPSNKQGMEERVPQVSRGRRKRH